MVGDVSFPLSLLLYTHIDRERERDGGGGLNWFTVMGKI